MLKFADNPPQLWPSVPELGQMGSTWWVAHTKARAEKAFAWDLKRQGIGYYLPMRDQVTVSGGRKRRVLKPLFNSYVFFCGDEMARYTALRTDRLCQVIEVTEPGVLVRELDAIRRVLEKKPDIDPYPQLAVGRRGRIKAGPFKATEGVVVEWHGRSRLILQVSMLGQGVAVEIEPELVEPISEPAVS